MAMLSGLNVIPVKFGSRMISDAVSPLTALSVAVIMIGHSIMVWLWKSPIVLLLPRTKPVISEFVVGKIPLLDLELTLDRRVLIELTSTI